jgi:hypothetical protein
MKTKILSTLCLFIFQSAFILSAHAQGTAFTYQGRLNVNGVAANGAYSFQFRLVQVGNGQPQGPTLTNQPVTVTNGLFTTVLDFGDYFGDRAFNLEIGVRTNGGRAFTILANSQPILSTPMAIVANRALAISGTLPGSTSFDAPSGVHPFTVNSATKIENLNSDLLDGLDSTSFWQLGGNAGTGGASLGTLDGLPLTLIAGNRRVLQYQIQSTSVPGFDTLSTVNTLGGSYLNIIAPGALGGTIAGGGSVLIHPFSTYDASPNTVIDSFGTIGGGLNNTVGHVEPVDAANVDDGRSATVAGGENNSALGQYSFVGGGLNNRSEPANSVIAGGSNNAIANSGLGALTFKVASGSSIGGGSANGIFASFDFFAGSYDALSSAIGGGQANVISGASYAAIPGGQGNAVVGDFGFAAGHRARAAHAGSFVWADSTDAEFASTAANQFSIRAAGGMRLSDDTPNLSFGATTRQMLNLWGTQYGIGVQNGTVYFRTDNAAANNGFIWYKGGVHNDAYGNAGGGAELMHLIDGGLYVHGTFVNTSDRNAKENFKSISASEILEKVVALPLSEWNYKQDVASRHVGPMAQDFYAAFGVGPDDKHITTVDESGVALAAIQGLNQKLEQKETEITELNRRLSQLEKLVSKLGSKKE